MPQVRGVVDLLDGIIGELLQAEALQVLDVPLDDGLALGGVLDAAQDLPSWHCEPCTWPAALLVVDALGAQRLELWVELLPLQQRFERVCCRRRRPTVKGETLHGLQVASELAVCELHDLLLHLRHLAAWRPWRNRTPRSLVLVRGAVPNLLCLPHLRWWCWGCCQ